jgi:hypothetical protein
LFLGREREIEGKATKSETVEGNEDQRAACNLIIFFFEGKGYVVGNCFILEERKRHAYRERERKLLWKKDFHFFLDLFVGVWDK